MAARCNPSLAVGNYHLIRVLGLEKEVEPFQSAKTFGSLSQVGFPWSQL